MNRDELDKLEMKMLKIEVIILGSIGLLVIAALIANYFGII